MLFTVNINSSFVHREPFAESSAKPLFKRTRDEFCQSFEVYFYFKRKPCYTTLFLKAL